jgi:hypothetical protein
LQNWYCLIHFPDGTESVHLVPGPAPVHDDAVIKIADKPGLWHVLDLTVRVPGMDFAAEISVRPATDEELTSMSGPAPETTTE